MIYTFSGLADILSALCTRGMNPVSEGLPAAHWLRYERQHGISDAVGNLLTHELCRMFIGTIYKSINADLEYEGYTARPDSVGCSSDLVSQDSHRQRGLGVQGFQDCMQRKHRQAQAGSGGDRPAKAVGIPARRRAAAATANSPAWRGCGLWLRDDETAAFLPLPIKFQQGYHGFAHHVVSEARPDAGSFPLTF